MTLSNCCALTFCFSMSLWLCQTSTNLTIFTSRISFGDDYFSNHSNEILWMDRHKEPYTTCSVCTFVPTLTPDQISVIVQVYNLSALPALPISWSGRWVETRRDTKTLVGLPEQTQIMQNVVHPLQTVHSQWRCDVALTRIFAEMSDDFANFCKCIARYCCQPVKYFYRYVRSGLCRPVEGAQGERGQGGAQSGWGESWLGELQRAAETEKIINIY